MCGILVITVLGKLRQEYHEVSLRLFSKLKAILNYIMRSYLRRVVGERTGIEMSDNIYNEQK